MTLEVEPKVFDVADIDFGDTSEWKKDLDGDETLLGLMMLGDDSAL